MSDATIPTIGTYDTSIWFSWEYAPSWKRAEQVKEPAYIAMISVVKLLRSRGWKVRIDKKVGALIRHGYRIATKGDLWLYIEQSGRCFKVEGFVEYNSDNRNGGRYCFDKLQRMTYLDRKRFELERQKILSMFQKGVRRPSIDHLRGMEWIVAERAAAPGSNRFDCHARPIIPGQCNEYNYNRQAADGSLLVDAQPILFRGRDHRLQKGVAYHNLNNMWWVLLPCGTVRNMASFELHPEGSIELRPGRGGDAYERAKRSRLGALLNKAKSDDQLEQAIVYRDIIRRLAA